MTRGQRKQMEDSSRGVFDLRLEPVFIKISSNTSAVWPSLNAQYLRWPKKYGQSRWLAYLEHLVRGNSRLRLGGMEQSPCPSLLVSLRWCRNLTLLSWPTFRCYRQIGKIGQFFLKSWGSTSFIAKLLVRVRLMGPVTLMSVLPAIRNSKVYPRKIPGLTMRNWKYPHLRHRPRTSGTRIMRLHPRSLLTMTSPWPRLVFFPQDFWLCQQISVFFHFPPSLSRTRWIRSVWSPWTLRPRWGTGDLGNRRKLKMTRWNTSVTLRFIPPYHGNSCHSNDVLWLA